MVGVSNPIHRRDPRAGRRFLAGFALGQALSVAALAGPLMLVAAAVGRLPLLPRVLLLVALVLVLAAADLTNRTPHVWRQVPQRFARDLHDRPGQLGLIWAFDLGLLVTTQKTTSLLWIALAGAVLLGPPAAVAAVLATAAGWYTLGVAVLTVVAHRSTGTTRLMEGQGPGVRPVRRVVGAASLALAAGLLVMLTGG